jgi:hypothetical protein
MHIRREFPLGIPRLHISAVPLLQSGLGVPLGRRDVCGGHSRNFRVPTFQRSARVMCVRVFLCVCVCVYVCVCV